MAKARITRVIESWKKAFWNKDSKEFLFRTKRAWLNLVIFYSVFYTILALLFATMLGIYYGFVDQNKPKLTLSESSLGNSPGLSFWPMPSYETTLIAFTAQDRGTYDLYINNIRAFLRQYDDDTQTMAEGWKVCSKGNGADKDNTCSYNYEKHTEEEGTHCTAARWFGYRDGEPCVLLKLNRVYGWVPDLYSVNNTHPSLDLVRSRMSDEAIPVACYGQNPADDENLGPVFYFPPDGFKSYYFPYMKQRGYLAPLQWVQFKAPAQGVIIFVECRAFAKNIVYQRREGLGMVHFELLVDS